MHAWWALLLLWSTGIELAEHALSQGNYRAALEHLAGAPEHSVRWHLVASKAYDGLNDPARAVAEAEAALRMDPRNLAAHLQLAGIFLARNTAQAAYDIYSEAQQFFPGAFLLKLGKGLALKELGRYEDAAQELETCLAEQPDSAIAFDALATVHLRRLRFAELEQLSLAFLRHNDADFRGHYFLAAARDGLSAPAPQVEELLKESLKRNPAFAAAHALLGKELLRQNRTAEAVQSLRRAIELRPDLVQAHLHLANAYRKLEDQEGAEREFAIVRELKRKEQEPKSSLHYRRGSPPHQ